MLNAKRREPSEITMPIATDTCRLKDQPPGIARNPARRSVERIALGGFAETRFVIQPNCDIGRAERMPHAAGHRAIGRHAQVADSLIVFVPQAPLFFAEILERKNGAEIVGLQ